MPAPHALRAAGIGKDVLRVDGEHPRLVHLGPALVGAPHSGVVLLDERPHDRAARGPDRVFHSAVIKRYARIPTSSTPGSRRRCGRSRRSGLARADEGPRHLVPDVGPRHRLRIIFLLGRAHDDDGSQAACMTSVRRRSHRSCSCKVRVALSIAIASVEALDVASPFACVANRGRWADSCARIDDRATTDIGALFVGMDADSRGRAMLIIIMRATQRR